MREGTVPGIFISDGTSVRIPEGGLRLTLPRGDDLPVETPSLTLELALDMWPHWLDVAIDSADAARSARSDLMAAVAAEALDGQAKGRVLERECKAAMVAMAAAGIALDNFYAVIQAYVPRFGELQVHFDQARTPRHSRISETMRRTFKVSQGGAKQLRDTVKELFTYRDWAVHPPAGFRPAIRHDFLDEGVEWRFVAFRASNAVAAAWAATSIIDQCLHAPRASNEALAKWCAGHTERSRLRLERAKATLAVEDAKTL
jgi:hypothetical protein